VGFGVKNIEYDDFIVFLEFYDFTGFDEANP